MNFTPANIAKLAAVGAASFAAVYLYRVGIVGAAKAAGEAGARVLYDATTGAVIGVGKAVGVPETEMSECAKAVADGRYWDASFACPAGTFVKSLFGVKPPASPTPAATQSLNGAECGCRGGMNAEAWIGLASVGLALYIHTQNRKKHRA